MCGIAGCVSFVDRPAWDRGSVCRRMVGCLGHRGPDAAGRIAAPFAEARFRRLAIVDPRDGRQPAVSGDGTIHALLNGEIYNHRELRRDLARRGHRLASGTDAEVLPALYQQYGLDCFRHINGMFAICIVDERSQRVILARDRLGIKPLYTAPVHGGLLFASEIKALLASGLVSRTVDPVSVTAMLNFFYCPGAETLVAGVRKLMPGGLLVAGADGTLHERAWYRLQPAPADQAGVPDMQHIETVLDDAVRLRATAEVPVGVSLSGGVDSSLIAEMVARNGAPVTAFTSICEDAPPEELPLSRRVAANLGLEHVVVSHRMGDFTADAPAMIWFADEPVADPAFYPAWKLAQAAAAQVKVLLLGAGADELFAGYRHHSFAARHHLLATLPEGLGRYAAALFGDAERAAAMRAIHRSRFHVHALAVSNLSAAERDRLQRLQLHDHDPLASIAASFEQTTCDPLNQQLHADTCTYLPHQVLMKVDRATMAASIEGRVPYLDHRLVELLFTIHGRWKRGSGRAAKPLLRRLARGRVPAAVLRRRKSGFPSPVFRELRESLGPIVRHAVRRPSSISARFLPVDWIDELCADDQRIAARAPVVHTLLSMEIWHELFITRGCTERPDVTLEELLEVPRRTTWRLAA